MKEYRDIYDFIPPDNFPGSVITLGRFDGVHLGHRMLLDRCVKLSVIHKLVSICFSFQELSYPKVKVCGQLTTSDEKSDLIGSTGIEVLLHPKFTPPLIEMTAVSFLEDILVNRLKAKSLVVGYDFHFGKDREGDIDLMAEHSERLGFSVDVIAPFMVGNEIVKSTNIRQYICDGDIEHANRLLGRNYSLTQRSIRGRGLGRKLGFPTINFAWPDMKVKPPLGVYIVRISSEIFGKDEHSTCYKWLDAVANFGVRPSIDPEVTEELFEVHVLNDFPGELGTDHGDAMFNVELIRYIREEKKFDSKQDLVNQITKDCDKAREYFKKA